MKFTIVGNILDSSGYASHTRSLFNALAKLTDVKLVTQLTQDWARRLNDLELEAIKKEDTVDRVKIIVTHPIYWKQHLTNKRNFAYCVWEGDKVPKSFINYILDSRIERVIVPSEHTKKAIQNTTNNLSVLNKIVVIPHGVDHDVFKPINSTGKKFTFLINKGFRNMEDRGGAQYGIKAYIDEFTNKDNVRLLFKLNPAYGIPNIDLLMKTLGGDRTDLPEIVIDINDYEYKDLAKLYQQSNVLLFPTRCEGFGLPCIEAMSCGIPVIYTDFGGQTDFAVGWKIPYKLEEVKHETQYQGIKWAIPDLTELKKTMREVIYNQDELENKCQLALEKSSEYSWESTSYKFIELADR